MAEGGRMIRSVVFLGVIAIFGCVIDSSAQSTEEPKPTGCPTITVSGPQGVVLQDSIAFFEASVTPNTFPNLTYLWTVNYGRVDEGQSTNRIGVRMLMENAGLTHIATVEVGGLPDQCPNKGSDFAPFSPGPRPILLSEFSMPTDSVHRRDLKSAAKELLDNPNDQMYIIEYFPRGVNRAAVRRKIDLVLDHLVRVLKFDRSRVTMVTSKSPDDKPLTKIYRIPPGAENPYP